MTEGFLSFFRSFATFELAGWPNWKEKGLGKMKRTGKQFTLTGALLVGAFTIWTLLIQIVDVQPVGQKGTDVGFSTLNAWFHQLTGVHMTTYHITDWMGLIPIFICMVFAGIGLVQLIKRKSLWKVDVDILFLGIYYAMVIFGYLIFEMIPINYRPILIEGFLEASYPSSTTLLVLSVMPTLVFEANRRMKNTVVKKITFLFATVFSLYMVVGRMLCGVHWFTDIIGSVILSAGLFCILKGAVLLCEKREKE